MKSRKYDLDVLRILCCYLVVFMHSCAYIINTAYQKSLGWNIAVTIVLSSVINFVSCYIIISIIKKIPFLSNILL